MTRFYVTLGRRNFGGSSLRLFLALSVIAGHAGTTILKFNGIGAWYAVNLFFIISGFYMAMVLNEKYRDTHPVHFYKSRIFRLFPVYYVGLLLSIIVSFDSIVEFFGQLTIGAQIFYIFQNLFIFGQDLSYLICVKTIANECANPIALTINPPAWSLAVELGFYLIAPFVLKSANKTFLYVLAGSVYLVSLNGLSFPLDTTGLFRPAEHYAFNYYFYESSFVFFGGGALAYHLNKEMTSVNYVAALFTLLLLTFAQTIMPFWHLLFICLAIPPLFQYTAKNKIDRIIGELSYPAYILHFPILLFLRPYAAGHADQFGFLSLGTVVAIVACAFGLILYLFLEQKVNKYRDSENFFHDGLSAFRPLQSVILTKLLLTLYVAIPLLSVAYIYYDQKIVARDVKVTASYRLINLTDVNWVKGIGRNWAGFFVENSAVNLERYKVGNRVKFATGETRRIVNVLKGADFINIYLNGGPLSGELVGYPNKVEIVE